MQVGAILFAWTGDHFNIPGRGLVYTATLEGYYTRSELSDLMNKTVESPDGVFCRIRGVEMNAVGDAAFHKSIGILLEPLERPFS